MDKNTYVCISYEACSRDEWKVSSGVRQGGVTSSIIFNFLNEGLADISNLPLECELIDSKVSNFCYADDIVLLAHTENASQYIFGSPAPKLESLSVNVDFGKSCECVFNVNSNRTSTALMLQGQHSFFEH